MRIPRDWQTPSLARVGLAGAVALSLVPGAAPGPAAAQERPDAPGSGCTPTIYLDGSPVPNFRVNDVPPDDVEAIEVYDGPAFPGRFRPLGACGSIVIWTRTGA